MKRSAWAKGLIATGVASVFIAVWPGTAEAGGRRSYYESCHSSSYYSRPAYNHQGYYRDHGYGYSGYYAPKYCAPSVPAYPRYRSYYSARSHYYDGCSAPYRNSWRSRYCD